MPQMAMAVPQNQAQFMAVAPNVAPGELIQVTSPDGQLLQVPLPQGVSPGQQFPVFYRPSQAPPMMAQVVAAPPQQGMMCRYSGDCDPWAALSQLGSVTIKQQVQWAQVIVGWDMPNKYIISDPSGRDLFVAAERTDGVMGMMGRQVFEGNQRPFNLDIAMLMGDGL